MPVKIVNAVGSAVGQGVVTGVWIAAGGLPAGKRRALRVATTAAIVAIGVAGSAKAVRGAIGSARDAESGSGSAAGGVGGAESGSGSAAGRAGGAESGAADAAGRGGEGPDRKRVALTVGLGAVSVASLVGRRRVERLWLARLVRNGHSHPHVALGVRMGLISAGLALAGELGKRLDQRP